MERGKDRNKNRNNIPDNNPSKAMDSRKEVEQSNDNKIDQDFPGYPHYPSKEDIMDQRTESHRVDLDVENIPSNRNATGVSQRFKSGQPGDSADNPLDEAETLRDPEDDGLTMLHSKKAEIGLPHNVSNEELEKGDDIPGGEPDDDLSRA